MESPWIEGEGQGSMLGSGSQFKIWSVGARSSIEDSFLVNDSW